MYKALFLSLTMFALSCSGTKQAFDPQSSKKDYLSFGNGGGFSGQVKKYYLLRDGSLWVSAAGGNEKVGSLSKSVCSQFFKNFVTLGLDKMSLNEPGNRYYFLGQRIKNTDMTLKWGKEPLADKNVETLYNILMNSVKDLEVKK